MSDVSSWLRGCCVYFLSIDGGVKNSMMLPRTQRIRDAKSQCMPCFVTMFDVSEAGDILFDMVNITAVVLDIIVVSRRII